MNRAASELPLADAHPLTTRPVTQYSLPTVIRPSQVRDSAPFINNLLEQLKRQLQDNEPSVKGFNIEIHCGEAAGQSVFHCHIHLIPRRKGDVENPAGGVRHLIPDKRQALVPNSVRLR
jgi:diadenosine tetraphosphate (Ap4A) HIT family hydrolase